MSDVVKKEFSRHRHRLDDRPAVALQENSYLRGCHERKHLSELGKLNRGSWLVLHAAPINSAFCPCTSSPVTELGARRENKDIFSECVFIHPIQAVTKSDDESIDFIYNIPGAKQPANQTQPLSLLFSVSPQWNWNCYRRNGLVAQQIFLTISTSAFYNLM